MEWILLVKEIGVQPGRLIESLIFLGVLWWKVKPHLTAVEDRMTGMESALSTLSDSMTKSFEAGEQRFTSLEHRMELMDDRISDFEFQQNTPKGEGEKNGKSMGQESTT